MVQEAKVRTRSRAWTSLGAVFLGLGGLGVVLPLLPTTPFLILAAACFARGSPRAYRWLVESRHLGPYIKSYREGRGLTLKAKLLSISALYVMLSISALVTHPGPFVELVLLIVAGAVTIHLILLPTSRLDG